MPITRDADAGMGERRAPGRARQAGGAAQTRWQTAARAARRGSRSRRRRRATRKTPSPMPSGADDRAADVAARAARASIDERDAEGRHQPLRRAEQIAALPGQRLAERHEQRAAGPRSARRSS